MKVLVVDDDKVTRDLLREVLEREGYEVRAVSSGEEAIRVIDVDDFPIVLSDIRMLQISGMGVLAHLKKKNRSSVVILMTGFGTMEGAIKAIQEGAFDYISKPFKMNELKALVGRAAKHWEATHAPDRDSGLTAVAQDSLPPKTLIGKSPQIVEVYRTLARATLSPSSVLIVGESGTGKELVARGIHDNSPRRQKKFIAVNCGALTETLLESELFGHVKGAFTGAAQAKAGLFAEADRGTLFLDEMGDIPPSLQVKLLRVLQEGEYKPVGSSETLTADVRIIAAAHNGIEKRVEEGKFREDLYYRLKVIRIDLPPLRDRMEDLPELVSHFLARFSERIGKNVSHVSEEAMALLCAYQWPGNIRELEHAIERAVTMTRTTVLYPEDFPPEIASLAREGEGEGAGPISPTSLEEVERQHIIRVLEENNYNKSKAAAILGIDRKTLHRKAQRYRIRLPEKE